MKRLALAIAVTLFVAQAALIGSLFAANAQPAAIESVCAEESLQLTNVKWGSSHRGSRK